MLKLLGTTKMKKNYFSVLEGSTVYILEDELGNRYIGNNSQSYFYDNVDEFVSKGYIDTL